VTTVAGHQSAKAIVDRVDPSLSAAESLAVRAVAHHETKYGKAWKEGQGKGSNNMGAIMTGQSEAECTGFSHPDSNPDGPFTGCFRIYESEDAGFKDLIRVLLKSNVKGSASNGDLRGIARGMFDNHYYTGTSKDDETNVTRYHDALRRSLDEILAATGEKDPFKQKAVSSRGLGRALTVASLLAIVGYGAYYILVPRPGTRRVLRPGESK